MALGIKKKQKIHILQRQGITIRQIASKLGISPTTVNKYLKEPIMINYSKQISIPLAKTPSVKLVRSELVDYPQERQNQYISPEMRTRYDDYYREQYFLYIQEQQRKQEEEQFQQDLKSLEYILSIRKQQQTQQENEKIERWREELKLLNEEAQKLLDGARSKQTEKQLETIAEPSSQEKQNIIKVTLKEMPAEIKQILKPLENRTNLDIEKTMEDNTESADDCLIYSIVAISGLTEGFFKNYNKQIVQKKLGPASPPEAIVIE